MKSDYKIRYSDRKTLGLSVERDNNVIIRAPKDATQEDIIDFVNRKKFWIYMKTNHSKKVLNELKTEFVSGASIMYLGRNLRLNFIDDDFDGIRFSSKFLISRKRKGKSNANMMSPLVCDVLVKYQDHYLRWLFTHF